MTDRRGARTLLLAVAAAVGLSDGAADARSIVDNAPYAQFDGVWSHMRALSDIAAISDGHRASGSIGYDRSADYVQRTLEAAGYEVVQESFVFTRYRRTGLSTLSEIAPGATDLRDGRDFKLMSHSAPAAGAASLIPVDVNLAAPQFSTSGCQSGDFDDFPDGAAALLQRGGCSFRRKAENASAAGAVAAVIFNQGGRPDRFDVFEGALTAAYDMATPVFAVSFDRGAEWATTPNVEIRFDAQVERRLVETTNVLAETSGGREDRLVMVGAHLDSVDDGPGMVDNASGSAAILEIAVAMARADIEPVNKVRFAWWGAEEVGLIGSQRYVSELDADDRAAIAYYLNFDMIASPNFVRFVMDGDGSSSPRTGPPGSGEIETVFAEYFDAKGLVFEPEPLELLSDYAPFYDAGIAIGGLFTGAGAIKSPEQAAQFGGKAGAPLDPCYHTPCDTLENVDGATLAEMTFAAEHAILTLAMRAAAPAPAQSPAREGR